MGSVSMNKTELLELTNIDVYKAINKNNNFTGYIFSIRDTENTESEKYRYYLINLNQNNKPIIRKLNNIINMLNSGNLILQKLEEQKSELLNFLKLIASIETQESEHGTITQYSNFFSTITEEDLKLLKPKL